MLEQGDVTLRRQTKPKKEVAQLYRYTNCKRYTSDPSGKSKKKLAVGRGETHNPIGMIVCSLPTSGLQLLIRSRWESNSQITPWKATITEVSEETLIPLRCKLTGKERENKYI